MTIVSQCSFLYTFGWSNSFYFFPTVQNQKKNHILKTDRNVPVLVVFFIQNNFLYKKNISVIKKALTLRPHQ